MNCERESRSRPRRSICPCWKQPSNSGSRRGRFLSEDPAGVGAGTNLYQYVVIVTRTAGGQVTQFVGSQTSTGPHFVNLPDHYWQGKLDAPDNVQFFKICLP
jgi:hypothetical protein